MSDREMNESAVLDLTTIVRRGRRLEYFTLAWNCIEGWDAREVIGLARQINEVTRQEASVIHDMAQLQFWHEEFMHSHMLTEQPRLFFMHFWAVGSPESVGGGIAAALKHVSTK